MYRYFPFSTLDLITAIAAAVLLLYVVFRAGIVNVPRAGFH